MAASCTSMANRAPAAALRAAPTVRAKSCHCYELAGVQVTPVDLPPYPGHPLVADARSAEIWFYGLLPILILLAAWLLARTGRLPKHFRNLQQGELR